MEIRDNMKINKDTKIIRLIDENMGAIDAIASINKHFKKLKNPILRKVLAPRVTIKDAANIGDVSVNELLKKLETIGFDIEMDKDDKVEESHDIQMPITDNDKIVSLDVRPTIGGGGDPFSEIMGAIKVLNTDETLKIINVFEPTPLIGILEKKGYKTWTNKISENEYHTYFVKTTDKSGAEVVGEMPIAEGSFDEKLASYGSNIKEVDVRHLEMPQPMVTILEQLEELPDDHVLLVNHKKNPKLLIPELETRNFQIRIKKIKRGYIQLIIFR